MEKLMKEMHGFLSPGRGLPLLLIPEYSGINKERRIHDSSKTTHRKPPFKCFLIPQHSEQILKIGLILKPLVCFEFILSFQSFILKSSLFFD